MVGNSPSKISTKSALISQIESLNLENHAFVFGDGSTSFIKHAFELSTVFLMLSQEVPEKGYFEGFGIVFLEAGYFGKPVIGSRSGGIPDAIEDSKSGFLVNSQDSETWVNKIEFLIQNPEQAQKMGEFGKRRVLDHFLWDKIILLHHANFD
jgi:phosphatidylinositol alpha-1,6-mannosyltransferase